jgi:hypothetical protein
VRILHSYRWRRRLIITTLMVAIAGPLIYLGVHYSKPGESGEATGPLVPETFYRQPKQVPFKAAERRKVKRVLATFVLSAVGRKHVERSWPVVGPTLRSGLTRREWGSGDIPVQPYPVSKKGAGSWEYVEYSHPREVGLEVLLWPAPGSGQQLLSADVKVIKDRKGRWRVDYFMPKRFHTQTAAPKKAAKTKAKTARGHRSKPRREAVPPASPGPDEPPRVGKLWWAIPLGILALIFIVPTCVGVFVWVRNRRAEAAYARRRG